MKYMYVLIFAGMLSGLYACGSKYGQHEAFGGGELYYKDGATPDDAQKLGNYLLSVGFFDDETPHSTQLIKRGDTYVFRFPADDKALKDESFARILGFMSMDISADVFNQAPVDVELTDGDFVALKTIPSPGERTRQGQTTVYRAAEIDRAAADKVTRYLTDSLEGENIFSYARQGDDFVLEILMAENGEKNLRPVNAYKVLAALISVHVLQNKPVTLHMLSENYSIRKNFSFEDILTTYRETLADSAGNKAQF